MEERLSEHFSLKEFCLSQTAVRHGINNVPNELTIAKMKALAVNVLEPARNILGRPIRVSSGFRCIKVNRLIGGADSSQHTKGEAGDLTCDDNAELFSIIYHNFEFDQLIWEFGDDSEPAWVHVSFREGKNRKEVLRAVRRLVTSQRKF
ncbi:MAG: D-Ala-D-Ala carboxypeptidase family metallohydrolase [Desulfobacterales bacterium]